MSIKQILSVVLKGFGILIAGFIIFVVVVGVCIESDKKTTNEKLNWRVASKDGINIRKGPGTEFEKDGQLQKGERILLLEEKDDWLRFKRPIYHDSTWYGWVKKDLVYTLDEWGEGDGYKEKCFLEVQKWTWNRMESIDFVEATGMVKNVSPINMQNVEVIVTFYDKQDNFITMSSALIKYNPIISGQSSPFQIIETYNPAMNKARIDFKYLLGETIPFYEK